MVGRLVLLLAYKKATYFCFSLVLSLPTLKTQRGMSHFVSYTEVGAISEKNAVYSTSTLRYRAPKNQTNLKKNAMLNSHLSTSSEQARAIDFKKINK